MRKFHYFSRLLSYLCFPTVSFLISSLLISSVLSFYSLNETNCPSSLGNFLFLSLAFSYTFLAYSLLIFLPPLPILLLPNWLSLFEGKAVAYLYLVVFDVALLIFGAEIYWNNLLNSSNSFSSSAIICSSSAIYFLAVVAWSIEVSFLLYTFLSLSLYPLLQFCCFPSLDEKAELEREQLEYQWVQEQLLKMKSREEEKELRDQQSRINENNTNSSKSQINEKRKGSLKKGWEEELEEKEITDRIVSLSEESTEEANWEKLNEKLQAKIGGAGKELAPLEEIVSHLDVSSVPSLIRRNEFNSSVGRRRGREGGGVDELMEYVRKKRIQMQREFLRQKNGAEKLQQLRMKVQRNEVLNSKDEFYQLKNRTNLAEEKEEEKEEDERMILPNEAPLNRRNKLIEKIRNRHSKEKVRIEWNSRQSRQQTHPQEREEEEKEKEKENEIENEGKSIDIDTEAAEEHCDKKDNVNNEEEEVDNLFATQTVTVGQQSAAPSSSSADHYKPLPRVTSPFNSDPLHSSLPTKPSSYSFSSSSSSAPTLPAPSHSLIALPPPEDMNTPAPFLSHTFRPIERSSFPQPFRPSFTQPLPEGRTTIIAAQRKNKKLPPLKQTKSDQTQRNNNSSSQNSLNTQEQEINSFSIPIPTSFPSFSSSLPTFSSGTRESALSSFILSEANNREWMKLQENLWQHMDQSTAIANPKLTANSAATASFTIAQNLPHYSLPQSLSDVPTIQITKSLTSSSTDKNDPKYSDDNKNNAKVQSLSLRPVRELIDYEDDASDLTRKTTLPHPTENENLSTSIHSATEANKFQAKGQSVSAGKESQLLLSRATTFGDRSTLDKNVREVNKEVVIRDSEDLQKGESGVSTVEAMLSPAVNNKAKKSPAASGNLSGIPSVSTVEIVPPPLSTHPASIDAVDQAKELPSYNRKEEEKQNVGASLPAATSVSYEFGNDSQIRPTDHPISANNYETTTETSHDQTRETGAQVSSQTVLAKEKEEDDSIIDHQLNNSFPSSLSSTGSFEIITAQHMDVEAPANSKSEETFPPTQPTLNSQQEEGTSQLAKTNGTQHEALPPFSQQQLYSNEELPETNPPASSTPSNNLNDSTSNNNNKADSNLHTSNAVVSQKKLAKLELPPLLPKVQLLTSLDGKKGSELIMARKRESAIVRPSVGIIHEEEEEEQEEQEEDAQDNTHKPLNREVDDDATKKITPLIERENKTVDQKVKEEEEKGKESHLKKEEYKIELKGKETKPAEKKEEIVDYDQPSYQMRKGTKESPFREIGLEKGNTDPSLPAIQPSDSASNQLSINSDDEKENTQEFEVVEEVVEFDEEKREDQAEPEKEKERERGKEESSSAGTASPSQGTVNFLSTGAESNHLKQETEIHEKEEEQMEFTL